MNNELQAVVAEALIRSVREDFTEEDAKVILNWQFGAMPIPVGNRGTYPVGVIKAIQKLGGIYQSGWGVTKRPKYQPTELI